MDTMTPLHQDGPADAVKAELVEESGETHVSVEENNQGWSGARTHSADSQLVPAWQDSPSAPAREDVDWSSNDLLGVGAAAASTPPRRLDELWLDGTAPGQETLTDPKEVAEPKRLTADDVLGSSPVKTPATALFDDVFGIIFPGKTASQVFGADGLDLKLDRWSAAMRNTDSMGDFAAVQGEAVRRPYLG